MDSKVSFTIRPPTTTSRPFARPTNAPRATTQRNSTFIPHAIDSSDEDEEDGTIEAVTGFDQSGAQRLHEKPKPSGPLVIPPLANRDWRDVARRRKQQSFVPEGADASTGKDGSQGGLGTRGSINSGPQATGLVMRKKELVLRSEGVVKVEPEEEIVTVEKVEDEGSEDERARRALLASIIRGDKEDGLTIDAIPVSSDNYAPPIDETDAYKKDVITRPESATLADYERVPVSQFGAALLRGMGWKEGTAASRTRRGLVEPWLPTSRPALLGIGAKERPKEDIPTTGIGGFVSKRQEKRYVPVVKLQREGSELPPPSRSRSRSPSRSRTVSRVPTSKSASPYPGDQEDDQQRRRRGRDKAFEDSRHYDRLGRDSHRDEKERDSARDFDRDYRKEWNGRERDRDRKRESGRDGQSRREKDYRKDTRRLTRDGDRY